MYGHSYTSTPEETVAVVLHEGIDLVHLFILSSCPIVVSICVMFVTQINVDKKVVVQYLLTVSQ